MYYFKEDDEFLISMREWIVKNPMEKPTDILHKVVAWNKGKKLSEEHKKAISDAHKNLPNFGNARPGIVFSDEHKKKLSEAAKNRVQMEEETKEKIRQKALNRKPVYDACPHCNYQGLKRVVYRYHRQNCKNLPV